YPEEEGKEPTAKNKDKDKEKKSAEKPKEKPPNDRPAAEKKPESTVDDPDKVEGDARRQLKYAKTFYDDGKNDLAIRKLKEIVKKYPKTKAAEEAKKYLEKLEQ